MDKLARWAVPGYPNRPFELGSGLLSEWFDFCDRFGRRQATSAHPETNETTGTLTAVDWLAGEATDASIGELLRVTLDRFPRLARTAAASRRPAVWCLYRVEQVPVVRASDGAVIFEESVPVPVSVGAARPEAVTQFPPNGIAVRGPQRFWCRGWDDTLPESHKWGTAPSAAAWIVEVSRTLVVPKSFRAR